ncbi:RNA polymerase II-associated protein [Dentipellis sp. KUC8613]|nr:RNA polymerase II-associated protein [Dentipellis sp. KUC8613]
MTSTDPLLALRNAVKAKYDISAVDSNNAPAPSLSAATHLRLSDSVSLPKTAPTRLRRPGNTSTDPDSNPEAFFSLEAVYLTWRLRGASGAEYMKQARESGLAVGFVSITERKSVLDWIEGKVPTLENIVSPAESTTPPGTPPSTAFYRTLPGAASTSLSSLPTAATDVGLSSTSVKRRYVPDAQDAEVVKKIKKTEIELRDRNTVLRGTKPNNFASVRDAFEIKLKSLKDKKPGGAATAPSPDPKIHARKAKNMYPIIMISSSPTALITMHNVKRFLQDAIFEPSADARARAASEGNPRAEDMIPIYRHRTTIDSAGREITTSQRYVVVDSVEALNKFGPDAWDRLVCVMTTGQAWQFRPYKWNEPRSLFHHVKGIYVSWTNDPPNTKIKDWNVTELKIDPNRRHVDKATVAHFWKTLDTWTIHNKPSLVKS